MAAKILSPTVQAGRRGDPIACDCCNGALIKGEGYYWSAMDVGPASFAWVTCHGCSDGKAKALSWLEKAMRRARRHSRGWAAAAERMMMASL